MNNILLAVITILYFAVGGVFIYFYWKNKYDLKETIKAIKKEFSKRCFLCVNKKSLAEEVGVEKSIELDELMNSALETNHGISCKEPVPGLSLDLCLKDPLNKDEIKIREKVLKTLNRKKQTVFDGGKEKLIVPMEAVLFLTKRYNPLVSEDGEIILNIKREFSSANELVKELTYRLESGETLYSEDRELLESIEKFQRIIKTNKKEIQEPEQKIERIITKEEPEIIDELVVKKVPMPKELVEEKAPKVEEVKTPAPKVEEVKTPAPKIEVKTPAPKVEVKTPAPKVEGIIPRPYFGEPIETKKEPLKLDLNKPTSFKEETIEKPSNFSSSPYGDDEEYGEMEDDDEMGINMDEILENAIGEIDSMSEFEDFEDNNEIEVDFYQKLVYKSKKGAFLDFKNLRNSMKNLFSDSEALSCFFNNLAKTSPLVLNPSKTVILADLNNIYFAISKMCGIEFLNCIDNFKNLRKENDEIIEVINEIFEHFVSDMISDTKEISYYLVKDKGSKNSFISRGAVFKVDAFLNGLSYEDLDYFRSTPNESKYTVVKKASKEDFKGSSPLIADIKDVEIF